MSQIYEEERQKYEEAKRQRTLERKEQASQHRFVPPTQKEFEERRQQTIQDEKMNQIMAVGEQYPSLRDRVAAAAVAGRLAAANAATGNAKHADHWGVRFRAAADELLVEVATERAASEAADTKLNASGSSVSQRYDEERQKYEEAKRQRTLERDRNFIMIQGHKVVRDAKKERLAQQRHAEYQRLDQLMAIGDSYPSMRDRVAAAAAAEAEGVEGAVVMALSAANAEIRHGRRTVHHQTLEEERKAELKRKKLEASAAEEAAWELGKPARIAAQQAATRQKYADQNRKIQQDLVAAATEQAMAGTKTAAAQSMRQQAISDIFEAGLAEDETINSMDERQLLAAILKELNLTRRDMWLISGKQPGVTMNKLTLGRASHKPGAFTGGKRRKTKRRVRGRKSRRNRKSKRR